MIETGRYVYKRTKRKKIPNISPKPSFANVAEQLAGEIYGIPAAQGEERFARALWKRKLEFQFRVNPTNVPTGLPGWLELDFLVVTNFGFRAFEIDDMSFVHRGAREAAETILKDTFRRRGLLERGIQVAKIEHVDNAYLQKQEDADRTVRLLL